MRPFGLARLFLGAALVAGSGVALASPPQHSKNTASTSTLARASVVANLAYMAGKQALGGPHAPSTRAVERDKAGRPFLILTTLNRNESLAMPAAGDDGGFASTDLDRAAHLLRAGSGEEHPTDPRVLSLVYRIETHFDVPEVRVVSGYRVPKPGSHSNHGKGRALDIIVPGVADEDVARYAREMGFVGVGIYPTSQFVHVDVRPHSYFWVDDSAPRARNHERCMLGDLAIKSDTAALARGQAPIEPFGLATDVDGALKLRGMAGTKPPGDEDEDQEN